MIGAILLGFGTGVVGRVLVPGGAFRILGTIIAGCHLKRNPGKIG